MCARCHFSRVQVLVTPRAVACQAPLSMGFSRQEHWSGLPFPTPGNLLDPEIKHLLPSPALVGGFFTTRIPWEALSPSIVGTHVSILFQILSNSFPSEAVTEY